LGDKKSWAGSLVLTDFLYSLVTKWKGEEAGRSSWGGRAGYLARPAGTEEMMMMLQQVRDLKRKIGI
jgi:hypothetical protein